MGGKNILLLAICLCLVSGCMHVEKTSDFGRIQNNPGRYLGRSMSIIGAVTYEPSACALDATQSNQGLTDDEGYIVYYDPSTLEGRSLTQGRTYTLNGTLQKGTTDSGKSCYIITG